VVWKLEYSGPVGHFDTAKSARSSSVTASGTLVARVGGFIGFVGFDGAAANTRLMTAR